jgi:hypothetical protein
MRAWCGTECQPGFPSEGGSEDLFEVCHRELRLRLTVAGQHGLEGLDVLQLRLRLYHRRNPTGGFDTQDLQEAKALLTQLA